MRESREEIKVKSRPGRISVHEANRNKITVEGLDHENFQYRWVNDTENRLNVFLNADWEFVPKKGLKAGDGGIDMSSRTTSAMSKGMGGGVVAYLMRLPKEVWLADQHRKEVEENAALEAEIRRKAGNASDYGRLQVNSVKDTNR